MIVSWNIRGLNKRARSREIGARLSRLQPRIAILVETRVKEKNAGKCRKVLGQQWQVIDNYEKHENGRIWVLWNARKIIVQKVQCSA